MITVDALVERGARHWGRFADRPDLVNPLDAYAGQRRRWERFRLKEWVGFTLLHPDWGVSMIIQDAKYLATSELYGCRRSTGDIYEHSAAGRRRATLPQRLLDSWCTFESDGYHLRYAFDRDRGNHRIMIDILESAAGPAFSGELQLDATHASAPLAVSSPLRDRQLGSAAAMFTYKQVFPAFGRLEINGQEIDFDPDRDFAIIDEHRTHLPYRADWDWGTFAVRTPAGILGANFAARRQAAGAEEESCIWLPGSDVAGARCEPLADVTFAALPSGRVGSDQLVPVGVTSADGRLELVFTPAGRKTARHEFVVAAMDYFQLCGSYRGVIRSLDGTSHELVDAPGVLERMHARL